MCCGWHITEDSGTKGKRRKDGQSHQKKKWQLHFAPALSAAWENSTSVKGSDKVINNYQGVVTKKINTKYECINKRCCLVLWCVRVRKWVGQLTNARPHEIAVVFTIDGSISVSLPVHLYKGIALVHRHAKHFPIARKELN